MNDNGTIYIGVDPGSSGGIAVIYDDGSLHTQKMPNTIVDLYCDLLLFGPSENKVLGIVRSVCYLEKVTGYTAEGGPQPGSRMFTFGQNYGQVQMGLIAARIPYEEVHPKRWQKALNIPPRTKAESKTDWKRRLKEIAQKLYPSVTITNATADAVLIAEACKRAHR